ncbi:MAG: hypothetical protein M4579_002441 [Chaenotheca gracillima]|nr:MAG: hypothetical protein M4579_002441 [Chaenotheca gracillima]
MGAPARRPLRNQYSASVELKGPLRSPLSSSQLSARQSSPIWGENAANFDPYNYTTGRWLHCDKLERESRYINFNFDALCEKVVAFCPGGVSITGCEKKEGGFNRAFIYSLDNGTQAVARLPFPIAGPRRLITNSEVATISYLRSNSSIPIPKIIDWSDDPSNEVGSEYIIMEHAVGV